MPEYSKSMKRDLVWLLLCFAAFLVGGYIRFTADLRAHYRRGWNDGVASVHREAAFNGHGHFPDGVTFRWNEGVLRDYAPKTPGKVLEPVKPDWATRILK